MARVTLRLEEEDDGLNAYMEVFTLDNPRGERPEIVIPPVPPDERMRISGDLLK